jgi:hypothetical protein
MVTSRPGRYRLPRGGHRLRHQWQHPAAQPLRSPAAQLGEHRVGQSRLHDQAGLGSGPGDREPQLGLAHRPDRKRPSIQRGLQRRVSDEPAEEVRAHRGDHQRLRDSVRAGRDGGRRVQHRDERPLPRPFGVRVPDRGEQLLELVDHQDQARRDGGCGIGRPVGPVSVPRPAAVRTACSTSIGASPGAADSDRYTETGSVPASRPAALLVAAADCPRAGSPAAATARTPGPGHRPPAAASARVQQRGLPGPRLPGHQQDPRPVQPPVQPPDQLARQLTAPVEDRCIPLPERHQPQIRAPWLRRSISRIFIHRRA